VESERQPGIYGKLPMHGDFVHRNLPGAFISLWDEWLQLYIAGSQEKMGEEWLEIYLTSPIWRFVLSDGVIDENHWAGILLPSVDQVGRYYPLSIVMPVPAKLSPLEFITTQNNWYEALEEISLRALEQEFTVDDLLDEIGAVELNIFSSHKKTGRAMDVNALQIDMEFEEQLPISVYPFLLDSMLSGVMNSYSVWTTRGSERVAPSVFSIQGLPPANNLPAMMDGQWSYWGWPQTYSLQ
jgi:type VI secretion system protein ImpM